MASPDSRPHCQGGEKVRRKRRKEDGDDDEKKTNSEKKARMKWTPELHQIFVNAVKQVEVAGKPGPKKIVELMRVEGLTRDNVASHYQKYKLAEEKKVNEAAAAAAVHLQQKMAIYDKYVPSSEEIYLQNHSISSAAGRPMPMPMAGDGYGSNRRNLLPPLDWSNYYSIGTQNNTLAALIPPPQQPIFQPLEQNLHTHFLPNNNMIGGGIPPPPHPMVHHQGYSSAAAPAGDVGGVSQQHLHPNPNPNPNHYPAFENVDSYLNFNGQDPLSGVPEQVLPNRRAKVENRRETAEYNAETSATEKLNGGGFPPTPPTKARFQLS